ncbi:hypothetical protein D920_00397 [Enterococcus faecalis 13-SD-W-01]|nr:hypothetical protein D920_00397 [Enterococcus faecalis 13-SD-W-01]
MKKKILIILGILIALGGIFFSSVTGSQATERVNKTWVITEKKVNTIFVGSSFQNIDISIQETSNDKTTVKVDGKITKDMKKKIQSISNENGELNLDFQKHGLTLMAINDEKNPLKVTILLGRETTFKKIGVDSSLADINVEVPRNFNGIYKTKIDQDGKLKSIPESTEVSNSVISVSTSNGDISIKKGG